MSAIFVCYFLLIFVFAVQSSYLARKSEDEIDSSKTSFSHGFDRFNLRSQRNPKMMHIHKRDTGFVSPRVDQTTLMFLFYVKRVEENSLGLLRNKTIRNIVNFYAAREDDLIYDYIFAWLQYDRADEDPIVLRDPDEFMRKVQAVSIVDDEYCPSRTLEAMIGALEYTLPEAHLFVITDSTTVDKDMAESVLEHIEKHEAVVSFIRTGICDYEDPKGSLIYQRLAQLSNGIFYDFNPTNGEIVPVPAPTSYVDKSKHSSSFVNWHDLFE